MKSVVVLQARTNSSRLPGKVLLSVRGLPIVVLAAKRAANTGRKLVVATSTEWSDDGLAWHLHFHGLCYFRGNLDNTLERVVSALGGYGDQTIVFRLTADNIFPDGQLLDEMEAEFLSKGLNYLYCGGAKSGLPYGMSVEVTRLMHLREASRESETAFDREHVTPYVIRKFGSAVFEKYKNLGKDNYRCTIDCMDDYLVVQRVFSDVDDPVQESFLNLTRRLESMPFQPLVEKAATKLVLGTAQLGGRYGIANKTGQPDGNACKELIKTAIANGVAYLDTARAYGNSELMIGQSLKDGWGGRVKIITKLSPLQECPADASATVVQAFVDASVFQSCAALSGQKIDVMMLHRASHLADWEKAAFSRLLKLQADGVFGQLGVSVQNPVDLTAVLAIPQIAFVQLPCNVLDWRWGAIVPAILAEKEKRHLVVHVRSALLQGLLPSDDTQLWRRAHVDKPELVLDWLQNQVEAFGRTSAIDLCLAYLNALSWVDGVSLGMETRQQLVDNLEYMNRPPLTAGEVGKIHASRPILPEASLNPAYWQQGET